MKLYYGPRALAGLQALGEVKLNEKKESLEGEALIAAAQDCDLNGSTIGVIGYGAIGKEVVRLAQAFGMKVLITDPYVKNIDQVSLDELLSQADFVVPLAVASEETENLINASSLAKMKKGAFL